MSKRKKVIKRVAVTTGIIIGLPLLLLAIATIYLTPERLAALIEKYGNEYLRAEIKLERAELTVWSSFPEVRVELNGLKINSQAFDDAPDAVKASLPDNAGKLLSVGSFEGSINPWQLLSGTVALGDIRINSLDANLVVCDSLANFDILPPTEKGESESKWKFTLKSFTLSGDSKIAYQSVTDSISTSVHLASMTVRTPSADNYDLDIRSRVSLQMPGVPGLSRLPLDINGRIAFNQDSLRLTTDNLHFSLATIGIDLAADADLRKSIVKKLNVKTLPIDIIATLGLAADELQESMPELAALQGNPMLSVTASLNHPYNIEKDDAPDMELTFDIPPSQLSYTPAGGTAYTLNHFALSGRASLPVARPSESVLTLSNLCFKGDGIDLSLSGEAKGLLTPDPELRIESHGNVDLHKTAPLFLTEATLSGVVSMDATARFHLSDISPSSLQNITANGKISVENLLMSIPAEATSLSSKLLTLTLGSNITKETADHRLIPHLLMADAKLTSTVLESDGITLRLPSATIKAGSTQRLLDASRNRKDIVPAGIFFSADKLILTSSADSMDVQASNLTAEATVTHPQGANAYPILSTSIKSDLVRYSDSATRMRIHGLGASLNANLRRADRLHSSRYAMRYDSIARANPTLSADSVAALARRRKSPQDRNVVKLEMDAGLKEVVRRWGIGGNLQANHIGLVHKSYPVVTRLDNLNLDFSLDSVYLHKVHITSESNSLSLTGSIANMRQLMLGRTRRPVRIRLFADIDSLDLNQISYNYERGVYDPAGRHELDDMENLAEEIPVDMVITKADTMPLIVPRNIDARICLNADKIRITELDLLNASGSVIMNDGAFSVDSVYAATHFGSAYVNMLYSTRDIDDINMSLDLGFDRIDITRFFNTFSKIRDMMPIAYNLHGMVSARLAGSLGLYPNMDINFNSINALLDINGSDLMLNQDPFIRKIMRLMLIRHIGDIPITDMNIQLSVHDNVMRLYPFSFSMDRYKFALLGENDFDSNMYYHLSVLKSPIPFKFGINVKGTFEHPKIRFGGAKYKENEAREIGDLIATHRVNFVKEMRLQLHKLVRKAALSYANRDIQPLPSPGDDKDTDANDRLVSPVEAISNTIGETASKSTKKILSGNKGLLEEIRREKMKHAKKKKK